MGLYIRPNSRQIPSFNEYTSDKKYLDIMYGYLQTISLPGRDGIRYVKALDINATKLGKELGMTRQTAGKYFINLQELLLVGAKEDGKYELTFIGEEFAYLVPNDVLELLVSTKMPHIISMYVFFCVLSYNRPKIEYALNAVKGFIGIAMNTYSNSYIVTDALDKLQEIGLLKHDEFKTNENGQWKSQKIVTNVVNGIGENNEL